MEAVIDRGESVDQMEPLLVGERSPHRSPLTDQVVELVTRATRFRSRLPPGVEPALAPLLDLSERQARRVTSALLGQGILTSPTSRSPLRLALPAALAPRLMPGLFPPEP